MPKFGGMGDASFVDTIVAKSFAKVCLRACLDLEGGLPRAFARRGRLTLSPACASLLLLIWTE